MIAFFKCSVATLILFCLRLKASEEGDKSVLRIDASFTRRFFINLVKSILKFNQEYYRCNDNITKDDVNVLYDIDIYDDIELDKSLDEYYRCDDNITSDDINILYDRYIYDFMDNYDDRKLYKILDGFYKSADRLLINYTDLAIKINTFLKLSAVNNRIKAYLKLSNNDLNISDGSFTKFIDENVDDNDYDCKALKQNTIYNLTRNFNKIFNEIEENGVSKSDLVQYGIEYTHFADYYLSILKLSIINELNTSIIKKECKLDITSWEKNTSSKFLHVGTNLCHSFEVSSDIDKKNSTVGEHFDSVTTDIIKFKFKTLETFTNNHYNTTENFCLYIEDLKRTQLSKFNSHGVNSGCIDATFRFLHKNLPCWLFKYVFEYPYLLTMNLYYNTQDLQNKFIERAKLINNDAFDNCYDDYGVNFLACILIDE